MYLCSSLYWLHESNKLCHCTSSSPAVEPRSCLDRGSEKRYQIVPLILIAAKKQYIDSLPIRAWLIAVHAFPSWQAEAGTPLWITSGIIGTSACWVTVRSIGFHRARHQTTRTGPTGGTRTFTVHWVTLSPVSWERNTINPSIIIRYIKWHWPSVSSHFPVRRRRENWY